MRNLALQSLFHDRSRFLAALAGATFAAVLVFTQLGLYHGFLYSLTAVVDQAGGDVWVMARATDTLDVAERLSPGSRLLAASVPCVARTRALVFERVRLRKPRGGLQTVRLVGLEAVAGAPLVPWTTAAGLPADLRQPMRVGVDLTDRDALQLADAPLGSRLEIGASTATVAVLSRGLHSGSTLPFVFASDETARRLARAPRGSASYWLLDLERPSCAQAVAGALAAFPGLDAVPRPALVAATRRWWLTTTGVGASLGFVGVMGLVVGAVIVGQTLYTLVRDHERELATLRALGARRGELAAFVAWQAAALDVGGIGAGALLSAGLRAMARGTRLTIVLPPSAALLGVAALTLMCVLAAAIAARRAATIDAAELLA